ncbi:uncharacterized protein LOC135690373 [Rhopilema esculentum]|uniref:uncharacterized protein LOC135690373 n=1 Tax=Rhopilema esculentum TaxID=499914 RepID=UPI0031D1EBDD
MFGSGRTTSNRPVSWVLSDDILDRNIDQLDRETPRCNLSEEEEEELERSKLAMESQGAVQTHQVPTSCIGNAWIPAGRVSDPPGNKQVPVTNFQSKNPTSPFMKRSQREATNQGSCQEPVFPNSGAAVTATVSESTTIKRLGYTSPTLVQQSCKNPTISSHNTQHNSHYQHNNQTVAPNNTPHIPASISRPYPSMPVSSQSPVFSQAPLFSQAPVFSNATANSQSKPMGMVTPQLPKQAGKPGLQKAIVSPQTNLKYAPPNASSRTKKVSQSSLQKLPPTKATVSPQQQQPPQTPQAKQQQQPKQPQQYKQVPNFPANPRLHIAYCQDRPEHPGCRDAKNWNDDPTKKAQMIRKVEDEILLRSRELDSCWQEDELDCVRDFTDMDRRKEMTYAETSEEGIFKRVSDEIIKRPPIWHDDEVDSVKDFSDRKCHERDTSKAGSEEKVCLSPPWYEEDEEALAREGVVMVHRGKAMTSSAPDLDPVSSVSATNANDTSTVSVTFPRYKYYEEKTDSVKDFSKYENGQEIGSRIPSSERIHLTPPWTPSGCQTPAEGVPLLSSTDDQQGDQPSIAGNRPKVAVIPVKEDTNSSCSVVSTSTIDTSGVKLRKKSKRNKQSEAVPYVVPRFDDMEEDSVKDFSAPERKLQGLSSKIPSYECIPFTPPWISHNNSGIQTPREYASDFGVPIITPMTSNLAQSPTSSTQAASVSMQTPTILTQAPASDDTQGRLPVLDSFRNTMHYNGVYGEANTTVDSVKNFSVGLIEETSRIPSSEQLCFTPPWIENEDGTIPEDQGIEEPDADKSAQELTLEEQRAIEEEVRKTGVEDAEAKAQEQRKSQNETAAGNNGQEAAAAGPPGRDSGFCSEQDQKQKQQEQQEAENALADTEVGKSDAHYQEDHDQCIIEQDKDDDSRSPNHCWSSKESSGSNQTDISTVVNPATSVPITAPGSPDPDGSEASDAEISEAEGHEPVQGQGSKPQDIGPKTVATAPEPEPVKSNVINTSLKNPYLHHNQPCNYQHPGLPPGGSTNLPSQQSFPRMQLSTRHFHTGSFDSAQQNYNTSQVMIHPRPAAPYQNPPQNFNTEQHPPRIPVQPYVGHYDDKGQMSGQLQGQMSSQMRGQVTNQLDYGPQMNPNLHYKGQPPMMRQPQPSVPHPVSHRMPHPHMHPQMAYYRGQKPMYSGGQGPLTYRQVIEHQGQMPMNHTSRQRHLDAYYGGMHGMMEETYSKAMQQGLLDMVNRENCMNEEKMVPHSQPQPRSVSQLNLQSGQDQQQKNTDNASVVSFSSVAASHQNLDTKVDMVSSLLSMLGTHDKDDVARTLLAMSSSTDSCSAMRQSGCLPLLIKLLHDPEYEVKGINWEARQRAGRALHNIINSGTVDRKGRREVRVLRLIEIVRAHSEAVLSGNMEKYQSHKGAPALRDHGPGPAVAALMKLSFEEEHKNTITELGGLQVIAELLQVDFKSNGHCKDPYSITLRKYAGMALINLTYSDSRNKNILLEMKGALKAVLAGLSSSEEEELVQVSAGILRNVSWKSDENGKRTLAEVGTARSLMTSVQHIRSEAAIRSILSAVWNLSAHTPDNKEEICSTPGSLKFLCYALNYRSLSRSLVIAENAGGIMRNISSHIAVKPEYRQILREHGCLKVLISHLRSPSTRVVSNACGILWNLSARCIEDQELLWELGAVSMLKTLVHSKHKSISTSSASALRNLMAVKPGSSSTDNESHASFSFKRSKTLPGKSRNSQNNLRSDRKYKSFFGKKLAVKETTVPGNESSSTAKKAPIRGLPNVPEDSRKVHRKVKHGEPHYYADLYQDPPRRGITMPQARDPTVVLYSSENPHSAHEGNQEESPALFNGSRVDRWNNLHSGNSCNCKHGSFQHNRPPQGVDTLQQGMQNMIIKEESPIITRQRRGSSSSSLSSCSPPSQPPHPANQQMPRVETENSPLSIFRDRKSNPGLCLHRRSMSDTISEFGHPSQLPNQPSHAVTDSELAKPDHFSWHNHAHKPPLSQKISYGGEAYERKEIAPKPQPYYNVRPIGRYDEVSHYETHFLSPYDDCPLSIVKDSVRFPHFSLGYRPKQDCTPPRQQERPLVQESTTPKVFVQETRYDVRQAYHRRSNETISSSLPGSREELRRRCKHNHSGTSVWQCDCYETGNVWIRKGHEKSKKCQGEQGSSQMHAWPESSKVNRSDSFRAARQDAQSYVMPPTWPNPAYQNSTTVNHPRIGSRAGLRSDDELRHSKELLPSRDCDARQFLGNENVFLGNDQRHPFQEKIISSPQGQYGVATPVKDPHLVSGQEIPMQEIPSREPSIPDQGQSNVPGKERTGTDKKAEDNEGKKPLRSSLKTPSDGLKKFRKKHITQKVVTSVEKKKSKGKDNVMVTSL